MPIAGCLAEKSVNRQYDFIIAGGGLAGLSLAYHLIQSNLRDRAILIIEPQRKEQNDRTWCFWTNQPTLFDEIVCRSWNQLQFKSADWEGVIDLRDYRYQMIRGIDFYRLVQRALSNRENVEFAHTRADRIEDDENGVRVFTDTQVFHGRWAFDSRFDLSQFKPDLSRYHYLQQHFKGWWIETPNKSFDPQAATLFDFRTEQKNDVRFFYVLPLSERQALIEYVLLGGAEYDRELTTYMETVLGIQDYRILAREGGVNPLTDCPLPRRAGKRIMTIGVAGGRVKPTSGYAFTRIQQDSAAMVDSLRRTDAPFNVPAGSRYYRLCDSLMLQLMYRHGAGIQSLFADLFKNNPVERVFHFLDERASPRENLALMASLPPGQFLRAFLQTQVLHQI